MRGWVDLSPFLKEWLLATLTGFCIPCCFITPDMFWKSKRQRNNNAENSDDIDEDDSEEEMD